MPGIADTPRPAGTQEADFAPAAARLAGLACALLGWRPDEFWQATPAELAVVLAALAPGGGTAAGPVDLAQLMEQFPDG